LKYAALYPTVPGILPLVFFFNIFIDPLAHRLANLPDTRPYDLPAALLFADDIKLQHTNHGSLQRLANICKEWADKNYMAFNIANCIYLGFPHGKNGINWPTFADKSLTKASGLVKIDGGLAKSHVTQG
ncbi:hypothetical protein HK104_004225, partial [Borealophlyctis nickersoniae]